MSLTYIYCLDVPNIHYVCSCLFLHILSHTVIIMYINLHTDILWNVCNIMCSIGHDTHDFWVLLMPPGHFGPAHEFWPGSVFRMSSDDERAEVGRSHSGYGTGYVGSENNPTDLCYSYQDWCFGIQVGSKVSLGLVSR